MNETKILNLKETYLNQFKLQDTYDLSEFLNYKSQEIIRSSDFFDEDFYFLNYPDVKNCGMDPIEHYVKLVYI